MSCSDSNIHLLAIIARMAIESGLFVFSPLASRTIQQKLRLNKHKHLKQWEFQLAKQKKAQFFSNLYSKMSSLICWSCVQRDGIILAEAGCDDGSTNVIKAAQKITKMKPTAGWEVSRSFSLRISSSSNPYRGIKFHLHEPIVEEIDGRPPSDDILIWAFCCVYNTNECSEETAKAFLTKLVFVSEPLRGMPWWQEGGTLSAQPSFAPTLHQQMENMEQVDKLAMMQQHVDETKSIMQNNVENILERGEKIEDLQEEAQNLNAAAKIFKKNAKKVRRFKMLQNAKHGVVLGTAVTGVVGVCVIPPLIALL